VDGSRLVRSLQGLAPLVVDRGAVVEGEVAAAVSECRDVSTSRARGRGSRLLTIATPQDRQGRDIRSPADRLRDLESLRERGLVTEEEYKQKRQRILDEF